MLFVLQVLLVQCAVACSTDSRDCSRRSVDLSGRRLLQTTLESTTGVRVVNFFGTEQHLPGTCEGQDVNETELTGRVSLTASDIPVLYGAYYLGPSQVAQLNRAIVAELVRLQSFQY